MIRAAVVRDAEAIARVYLDSLRAAYSGIASDEYLSQRSLAKCVDQWTLNIVEDETVTVVVSERDGMINGLASFGPARDTDVQQATTGELQAIYVSPESWSQGIGGRLCEHALNDLRSSGCTSVLLWVLSDNTRAIRFYEHVGFRTDGASRAVSMGYDLTAIRLQG